MSYVELGLGFDNNSRMIHIMTLHIVIYETLDPNILYWTHKHKEIVLKIIYLSIISTISHAMAVLSYILFNHIPWISYIRDFFVFLYSAYVVSPGPTIHKKLSCGLFVKYQ